MARMNCRTGVGRLCSASAWKTDSLLVFPGSPDGRSARDRTPPRTSCGPEARRAGRGRRSRLRVGGGPTEAAEGGPHEDVPPRPAGEGAESGGRRPSGSKVEAGGPVGCKGPTRPRRRGRGAHRYRSGLCGRREHGPVMSGAPPARRGRTLFHFPLIFFVRPGFGCCRKGRPTEHGGGLPCGALCGPRRWPRGRCNRRQNSTAEAHVGGGESTRNSKATAQQHRRNHGATGPVSIPAPSIGGRTNRLAQVSPTADWLLTRRPAPKMAPRSHSDSIQQGQLPMRLSFCIHGPTLSEDSDWSRGTRRHEVPRKRRIFFLSTSDWLLAFW